MQSYLKAQAVQIVSVKNTFDFRSFLDVSMSGALLAILVMFGEENVLLQTTCWIVNRWYFTIFCIRDWTIDDDLRPEQRTRD
jgi:hypothetical protein